MKIIVVLVSCAVFWVASHIDVKQDSYRSYSLPAQTVAAPVAQETFEQMLERKIGEAGFPDPHLMVAIVKAESGMRIDAIGDIALQDNTWGASVGLFQIRTLKTQNKGCRDESVLANNVDAQVSCAKQIFDSQGYKAWSAFSSGIYKKYL